MRSVSGNGSATRSLKISDGLFLSSSASPLTDEAVSVKSPTIFSMSALLDSRIERAPSVAHERVFTDSLMLLHTEEMSILLIWFITLVAESEKLSSNEGLYGMYMLRGVHAGGAGTAASPAMFISTRESPVTPLAVTVAWTGLLRSIASLASEKDINMYILYPSGPATPYSSPTKPILATWPIFTPRKFTTDPTDSPLTGLSQ